MSERSVGIFQHVVYRFRRRWGEIARLVMIVKGQESLMSCHEGYRVAGEMQSPFLC